MACREEGVLGIRKLLGHHHLQQSQSTVMKMDAAVLQRRVWILYRMTGEMDPAMCLHLLLDSGSGSCTVLEQQGLDTICSHDVPDCTGFSGSSRDLRLAQGIWVADQKQAGGRDLVVRRTCCGFPDLVKGAHSWGVRGDDEIGNAGSRRFALSVNTGCVDRKECKRPIGTPPDTRSGLIWGLERSTRDGRVWLEEENRTY